MSQLLQNTFSHWHATDPPVEFHDEKNQNEINIEFFVKIESRGKTGIVTKLEIKDRDNIFQKCTLPAEACRLVVH